MTPATRRLSSWARLVTVSALIMGAAAIVLVAWWVASGEERIAGYRVTGVLNGIALDVGSADVEIVGSRSRGGVSVQRTERIAFGRAPEVTRRVERGVLRIGTRCPSGVPSTCSAGYRLVVPDNIPITVRTAEGDVRFVRFRGSAEVTTTSGDVEAQEHCGFLFQARTDSGDVRAATTCALERLALRSRSGTVRATVPGGRYRVDVSSDEGSRSVAGPVEQVEDAPFAIQMLSSTGDVALEAMR